MKRKFKEALKIKQQYIQDLVEHVVEENKKYAPLKFEIVIDEDGPHGAFYDPTEESEPSLDEDGE